ncbi:SRPBCC family protein [Streptomyces sp. NPDC003327]
MEHEVFVPVPAEVLRATLTDPARVARCVPGLQRDADAEAGPLAGRLKLRVGGNTITYRGALRIVERDDAITYEGEGAEVRGKGEVEVSLTVVLTPLAEGTSLSFTGAVSAAGRLAEAPEEARATAGIRLLDRFAEAVAGLADETAPGTGPEEGAGTEPEPGTASGAGTGAGAGSALASGPSADGAESDEDGVDDGIEEPGDGSLPDTPVLPTPLDAPAEEALAEEGLTEEYFAGEEFDAVEFPVAKPAAEAAHARRTMIGRSAEEVDHAPPRGRYAPVPAPEASGAGATLRWVAPAAALALASAVVVGRALRRRR